MSRVVAVALLATVVGPVVACGPTPRTSLDQLVGAPLEEVSEAATADADLLIQDASPLVGAEPSYDGGGLDLWTVIALCADSRYLEDARSVEVAVVLRSDVTRATEKAIDAGEFGDAVSCEGRPFDASPVDGPG